MHRFFIALTIALAVAASGQRSSAQSLTYSLFGAYLDALREQAGIPGMSALVVQNGTEIWARGFGRADLARSIDATPDTPYPIGGLSQVFGSTLLLQHCIEQGTGALNDPVADWVPGMTGSATLWQLLAHVTPAGTFQYDPGRFAMLTPAIEACADAPYGRLLVETVFSQFGMARSVPGTALASPDAQDVDRFGADEVARFLLVLNDVAVSYRTADGRAVATAVAHERANAASGVVTTARDLARFDDALRLGVLLDGATLVRAWSRPAAHLPAGLGWFVQAYGGEPVVWQFGVVPDAYSALIVKLPGRGLTFVLLANSDALGAPFARETWDVTASVFARLFLRVFVG